jgi:hypothetical protein
VVEGHGRNHAGGEDLPGYREKIGTRGEFAAKNGQIIKMRIAECGVEKKRGKAGSKTEKKMTED